MMNDEKLSKSSERTTARPNMENLELARAGQRDRLHVFHTPAAFGVFRQAYLVHVSPYLTVTGMQRRHCA